MPRRRPKGAQMMGWLFRQPWRIEGDFLAADVPATERMVEQGALSDPKNPDTRYWLSWGGGTKQLPWRDRMVGAFLNVEEENADALRGFANSYLLPARYQYPLPGLELDEDSFLAMFRYPLDGVRAEVCLLRLLSRLFAQLAGHAAHPLASPERVETREQKRLQRIARLVAEIEVMAEKNKPWPPGRFRRPSPEEVEAHADSLLTTWGRGLDYRTWWLVDAEVNAVIGNPATANGATTLRKGLPEGLVPFVEHGRLLLIPSTPLAWVYLHWLTRAGSGWPYRECAHPTCGQWFYTSDRDQLFCSGRCQHNSDAWRAVPKRALTGDDWKERTAEEKREKLREQWEYEHRPREGELPRAEGRPAPKPAFGRNPSPGGQQ